MEFKAKSGSVRVTFLRSAWELSVDPEILLLEISRRVAGCLERLREKEEERQRMPLVFSTL